MDIISAPQLNPQLIINPELSQAMLDSLKAEYLTERTELPHQSELIYCLARSYDNRIDPIPPTDEELMLWCLGFGLERVLLHDFERPPMKCKDGIYYSVDFISLGATRAELKTTRTSMKRHIEEGLQQTWLQQIAGYCYAEGQTEFDLVTLYLLGDYKPPFPKIIGRRLVFTELELMLNWAYLLNRKDWYLLHLTDEQRPNPYTWNLGWECDYCRYKIRCEVAKGGEG